MTTSTQPARATGLPESDATELQITESLPGDESERVEARAIEPASISPISDPAFAGLRLTNPARLSVPVATNLSSRQVGPGETPRDLPADAWQQIMESIRQDRYRIKPNLSQAGPGYRATNHSRQLQAAFHPEGLDVTAVRPPRRPAGQRPAQRARGAPTGPTTAAPHSLAVGPAVKRLWLPKRLAAGRR